MSLEESIKPAPPEPKEAVPVEPEEIQKPVEYRVFGESMSEEIGQLAGALAKAQGAMSNGAKDKQGYGYKYMELGALIDIARPALAANAISIIQSHELVKGKSPSVVTHTTVMHESGQWHKSSIELPIKVKQQLSQAQMIGVNCTYGRRYALQAICLIASEDDTDAK
jgi:hypothetical protein